MSALNIALFVTVIVHPFLWSHALVRVYNLTCITLDEDYVTFSTCKTELLNRDTLLLNLYAKVKPGPIHNVTINFSVWKKDTNFKPYIHNLTYDFCWLLRKKNIRAPFVNLFFSLFREHSNINHSCPFNHDLIVKDQVLRTSDLRYVPLPDGNYMFDLLVGTYNIWRANVKVKFTNSE